MTDTIQYVAPDGTTPGNVVDVEAFVGEKLRRQDGWDPANGRADLLLPYEPTDHDEGLDTSFFGLHVRPGDSVVSYGPLGFSVEPGRLSDASQVHIVE